MFEMTETILQRAPAATKSFLGPDVAANIEVSPLTATTPDQIVESGDSFALSVPLAAWTTGANVSNPFPVGNSTLRTLSEIASRSELANAVEKQNPSGSFRVSSEPVRQHRSFQSRRALTRRLTSYACTRSYEKTSSSSCWTSKPPHEWNPRTRPCCFSLCHRKRLKRHAVQR